MESFNPVGIPTVLNIVALLNSIFFMFITFFLIILLFSFLQTVFAMRAVDKKIWFSVTVSACVRACVCVCVHAIYNLRLAAYLVILHALLSSAIFFYSKSNLSKSSFTNTIRLSNSLDPDHFVGPDLGLNCLQKLTADGTSRQRVNILHILYYWALSFDISFVGRAFKIYQSIGLLTF